MDEPGLYRDISKSSIAIIFEQMRGRFFSGWKSLESPTIHQKNVQPAVVVVVIERNAAARRLEQILVLVLTAVDGLGIQPSCAADVDKRCSQRIMGFGRSLRFGPQMRHRSRQTENVA